MLSVSRLGKQPTWTQNALSQSFHSSGVMATEDKKALRKFIKSRLDTISTAEVTQQSNAAQNSILRLHQWQQAKRVSVYLAMPKSEAQTYLLLGGAFEAGKEVFVPYIHRPKSFDELKSGSTPLRKRKIIDMLRLRSLEEYEALERDAWGIPSLPVDGLDGRENASGGIGLDSESVGDAGLDLIVVPGVAFDTGMNRLGHGAGFYDEYLTRYCADGRRKKPFLGELVSASSSKFCGVLTVLQWACVSRSNSCRARAIFQPATMTGRWMPWLLVTADWYWELMHKYNGTLW